jgi:hypothetical protein
MSRVGSICVQKVKISIAGDLRKEKTAAYFSGPSNRVSRETFINSRKQSMPGSHG